jgi:hypothetical protein
MLGKKAALCCESGPARSFRLTYARERIEAGGEEKNIARV